MTNPLEALLDDSGRPHSSLVTWADVVTKWGSEITLHLDGETNPVTGEIDTLINPGELWAGDRVLILRTGLRLYILGRHNGVGLIPLSASQVQVNAGLSPSVFVSPKTLRASPLWADYLTLNDVNLNRKWLDGEQIYSRTFTVGITEAANTQSFTTLMTDPQIVNLVSARGGWFTGDVNMVIGQGSLALGGEAAVFHNPSSGIVRLVTRSPVARVDAKARIYLEYTKTT